MMAFFCALMRMTKIGRVDRNEVAFSFAGIEWDEVLYKWVFVNFFLFIFPHIG
ncbi:hypothetical protein RO3G_04830 [Rhizopus delemar RA 99-880]|uniref:Uncharacterized protein n=1 Tax=Rhizopus delemar (strain RA 99-880 / ATCC MYA-4621 / FGSC 9543 / NRRL 43880) TaxID=246409 RepID=I1BV95_RHIO9|nr:hypothetical protein RO3G_04830 [Rhizopus delemar RA 99-880]|eukprot:EIE80125.1 hypothetical protein RO3G_04830 [Rhizopus delemar RA 99-880]